MDTPEAAIGGRSRTTLYELGCHIVDCQGEWDGRLHHRRRRAAAFILAGPERPTAATGPVPDLHGGARPIFRSASWFQAVHATG
jgi:hypothetical protein